MPETVEGHLDAVMETVVKCVAVNVNQRRTHMGLSLDEVSKAAGVSKTLVWELEQGRAKNPSVRSMIALGSVLGLPVGQLLGFGADGATAPVTTQEMNLVLAHRRIFKPAKTAAQAAPEQETQA